MYNDLQLENGGGERAFLPPILMDLAEIEISLSPSWELVLVRSSVFPYHISSIFLAPFPFPPRVHDHVDGGDGTCS